MSDFPEFGQTPLFLHPFTMHGPADGTYQEGGVGNGASVTWVANQAVYMPMDFPFAYPVQRVFWGNGSAGGANVDFGIYTPGGSRIYSTGSTAQSGTSTLQFVTPTTPFVLPPGRYYFAFACSGTTNTVWGNAIATAANGALGGLLSQASAFPLPSPATFATYVTPGLVLCGVTRTAAGTNF